MKLLSDKELHQKITSGELISVGFSKSDKMCWTAKDSAIQPSSLDLHIGDIYIPHTKNKSFVDYCLKPGETVVIRTREKLELPDNVAAIGFPPTVMSRKAILTTNPGHVDPGYRGVFHITLINMGKKTYPLKKGDLIVTLLFFELDNNVYRGYMQRVNDSCEEETCPCNGKDECDDNYDKSGNEPGELDYLASDFMDFECRTKEIAEKAVKKAEITLGHMKIWVPVLAVVISGIFAYLNVVKSGKIELLEKINAETRLQKIEKNIDEFEYKERINNIEEQIKSLNEKIESANKDSNSTP